MNWLFPQFDYQANLWQYMSLHVCWKLHGIHCYDWMPDGCRKKCIYVCVTVSVCVCVCVCVRATIDILSAFRFKEVYLFKKNNLMHNYKCIT